MKPLLSRQVKILLVIIFLIGTTIGFMIKLPSTFRHIDKEMHAAFYFLAAGAFAGAAAGAAAFGAAAPLAAGAEASSCLS